PARHRHPKHNVRAPAHTAEQETPRHLDEAIERQTMLTRLLAQPRAQPLTQRKRDLLGRNRRPPAIRRRQTGGLFHPRPSPPPRPQRPRPDPPPPPTRDNRGRASHAPAPSHPPCAHRA